MQTPGEPDVTDFTPSPSVFTVAVKPPPSVPFMGRFEMVIVVGIFCPTGIDCGLPVAAV